MIPVIIVNKIRVILAIEKEIKSEHDDVNAEESDCVGLCWHLSLFSFGNKTTINFFSIHSEGWSL